MLAIIFLFSVITLSQILLGMLLWLESRRTKRKDQRLFVAVLLVTLFWTFCNAGLSFIDAIGSSSNIQFFDYLNRGGFFLGVVTLISIYWFSFYYPIQKDIKKSHKFIFLVGLATAILSPLGIISGEFSLSNGIIEYQTGDLSFIVGALGLIILASIILSDFKILFRSKADVQLRRQTITLLSGIGLMVVHAVIFIIILPEILGQNTYIYVIGYLAPYYFIFLTVYGLLRQGLFDVRLVIARLVGYVLSIGALAALYALISFGITNMILPDNVSQNVLRGTYTLLAVVLAFSFQPQKKFFDRLSNKIFYQDAYDAQALLDGLNTVLVSAIDLQKILSDSAEVINRSLKSDFIVFSIKEKNKAPERLVGSATKEFSGQDLSKVSDMVVLRGGKTVVADDLNENQSDISGLMRQNDIAVIVRITDDPTSKDADIGYMVLGNKKSGSPFSGQDIRVLEIIADELVIAIQNALRFEEIKNFNITLQEKVDDATKKLRDANKRLIELDQTKDDFISMASHQLRTPLTSIKGYVSMVMEGDAGKISKKQSDLLGQSFNSAQRMVYLIADLLNVSRLRTGKFVIDRKKTNLAEVIDGEMAQLKESAKARNLELAYKKPSGFPELMLDETKIRQVIMNFIDNAIYYTPKEGHITVNLEDKGENIEFTVVDDGIGVPKNVQHNLFNKFYRADNAKKARPDGTGLGLFMAKKVVVAQGGSIIFASTEGKGSTFGFSFTKKPLLPENFKGVTQEEKTEK